jgi:hypothetical protein
MTSSQASMQAVQAMHWYCRPLRISMPVGQAWTQRVQSTQSPSGFSVFSCVRADSLPRAPRGSPRAGS